MTARPLPRSRLDAVVPSLVAGQALVALVPATGDLRWAAAAAWDVARAAAQGGRRVALVDLWFEEPRLHEVVGLAPAEGIVDAFEYDVSLAKAAHEVRGVFFIAAGAATAQPDALYANPRWRRLQGGFRVEGALLLLFLPAGALGRLAAVPDGLLVLAPDGYEPEAPVGQGVSAALERGVPLLGVVCERASGPVFSPRAEAPPPGRIAAAHHGPRRRRARPLVLAAAAAAGAAGGWALLARGAEHGVPPAPPPAPAAPAAAAPAPTPALPPVRLDSLPWTVQLVSYATLDKALALGDRLAAEGVTPLVTPVAVPGRRRAAVWYRVLAGAYATREAAVAARAALWARGLAERGQGEVLHAPYSLLLDQPVAAESLRARGIPAVAWGREEQGGRQVLLGAFESAEQANVVVAQLQRARVGATLVTRMGVTP